MTGASDDRPATTFPADLGLAPDDAHNRRLVASVHPADWRNPEPAPRYNLVVVARATGRAGQRGGSGPGSARRWRWSSADCSRRLPQRRLRAVEDAAARGRRGGRRPSARASRRAGRRRAGGRLRGRDGARSRRARRHRSARLAERFARHYGVDVFLGDGRFVARDAVEVGGARLRFAPCGDRDRRGGAAVPPIPGLVEASYLTNETVFNLTRLPARLAVIGGGPIGWRAGAGVRATRARVNDRRAGRPAAAAR